MYLSVFVLSYKEKRYGIYLEVSLLLMLSTAGPMDC
jgi:hypothetical protein